MTFADALVYNPAMHGKNDMSWRALLVCALAVFCSAARAETDASRAPRPLLSGFHPDPSVCIGHDGAYYLTTSTFLWRPGLPVYRSEDFRNWSLAGHALGPQFTSVDSNAQGGGALYGDDGGWAPTIRFHDGTYYMVFMYCGNGVKNYITTAKDPAGPWTEPVWVDGADGGIDPSLFFDDDGRVYWAQNVPARKPEWTGHNEIFVQEVDLAAGRLFGRREYISCGVFPSAKYAEGPHIYKIGGKYLLLHAEGGTEFGHAETAKVSDSIWGPYMATRNNPLITRRDRGVESPLQATGHADIVRVRGADENSFYAVFLGKRPVGADRRVPLGRETFACPAVWRDGELVFLDGQMIEGRVVTPEEKCSAGHSAVVKRVRDLRFDETVAAGAGESMVLWRGADAFIELEGPGVLRMTSEDGIAVKCFRDGSLVKIADTRIVSEGDVVNKFNGLGIGIIHRKDAPAGLPRSSGDLSLMMPRGASFGIAPDGNFL